MNAHPRSLSEAKEATGYTCYGEIDTTENSAGLLPIGLTENVRVVKPVAIDEPIPLDAVELDEENPIVRARFEQDGL